MSNRTARMWGLIGVVTGIVIYWIGSAAGVAWGGIGAIVLPVGLGAIGYGAGVLKQRR